MNKAKARREARLILSRPELFRAILSSESGSENMTVNHLLETFGVTVGHFPQGSGNSGKTHKIEETVISAVGTVNRLPENVGETVNHLTELPGNCPKLRRVHEGTE